MNNLGGAADPTINQGVTKKEEKLRRSGSDDKIVSVNVIEGREDALNLIESIQEQIGKLRSTKPGNEYDYIAADIQRNRALITKPVKQEQPTYRTLKILSENNMSGEAPVVQMPVASTKKAEIS